MIAAARTAALLALLGGLAACGGVRHRVHAGVPRPESIAVLPFHGQASAGARELARALVQNRLSTRGLRAVELPFVDGVLAQHGWLVDAEAFDPAAVPLAEAAHALGVDAIVAARDLDETRFNWVILRRHAFGGALAARAPAGDWWSAEHSAGSYGGFLLTSGQVFAELRAQGLHGTPMATVALVDEFVEDVVATLPAGALREPDAAPALRGVRARIDDAATAGRRLVVEADADAAARVCFDLPDLRAVPMAPVPGAAGVFRGAQDLPTGAAVANVVVRARGPFGAESAREVRP